MNCFEFDDIEQIKYFLKKLSLDIFQLTPSTINIKLYNIAINDLSIKYFYSDAGVEYKGNVVTDSYSFAIHIPYKKEIFRNETLTKKTFMINEPNKEFDAIAANGHRSFSLIIPKKKVEQLYGPLKTGIYSINEQLLNEFHYILFNVIHTNLENNFFVQFIYELILDKLNHILVKTKEFEAKSSYHKKFKELKDHIHKNYQEDISINDLSEKFNITDRTIRNIFMNEIGISPKQYQKAIKLNYFKKSIIENSKLSISEIMKSNQFQYQSLLTQDFNKLFNSTPKKFQNKIKKNYHT